MARTLGNAMPSIRFNPSPQPTLGIELELQIVDADTMDHVPAATTLLTELGDPINIKHELFESTVEINTGICTTVSEAISDLQTAMDRLREQCEAHGWAIISAGTHPFADWRDQTVSPDPRYTQLVERIQLPARRLLIFGIHFHVGIDGAEKAIAVQNSLAAFVPHFLALSASSPFWQGEDSGMASSRAHIFEIMPTAGLPYRMANWSEFLGYMAALQSSRSIESIREVWTDIRPHPDFGTLELRICDGAPTLGEVASLAAFAQSLVVWLSRNYDRGVRIPMVSPWIVRENKWRAARFGIDADIITADDGSLRPLLSSVRDRVEDLMPVAAELGCEKELLGLEKIAEVGPSYLRQRRVFDETRDLRAVVGSLVAELDRNTVGATA